MRVLIKIGSAVLNCIYGIIKLVTTTRDKVTMISRQSDELPLDFSVLEQTMREQLRGVQIVSLCRTLDRSVTGALSYSFHILKQMYHISTSKVVILDSYCIAISVLKHKKNLTVIQMWHSMGTMKKFGYSILDKAEGSDGLLAETMKMHKNYDYVFASSDAYSRDLAEGFNCDTENIRVYPLPRYDLLKSESYRNDVRMKIFSRYPQLQERKNILYCPTFRKDESELENALHALIESMDQNSYNLIVKLHPLSKIQISLDSATIPVDFSTFDMLFVADYVVSDYSCVVYEAGVCGIPLYFYSFDLAEYEENRGLNLDYREECPGIVSSDGHAIIKAIESEDYDWNELVKFTEKYISATPHATKDIVDFILKFLK